MAPADVYARLSPVLRPRTERYGRGMEGGLRVVADRFFGNVPQFRHRNDLTKHVLQSLDFLAFVLGHVHPPEVQA